MLSLCPAEGSVFFEALQNDALLDCIAEIGGRAQWLTSVRTGSLLLGAAGLLRGYRSACYWYARSALKKFGAIPDASRTVIDRNRASGGGLTAGIDFGLAMIGTWAGPAQGRLTELLLEYAPQPPFGAGRPELADAGTLAIAAPILDQQMPFALVDATARRRGLVV
jgi:cyclohexyl-isocyanide hydratase